MEKKKEKKEKEKPEEEKTRPARAVITFVFDKEQKRILANY